MSSRAPCLQRLCARIHTHARTHTCLLSLPNLQQTEGEMDLREQYLKRMQELVTLQLRWG